jgi:phosphate acetyltransferase
MSNIMDELKAKIKGKKIRIVFPEGNDVRILEAIHRLANEDLVVPVVLNAADGTIQNEIIEQAHTDNDPRTPQLLQAFVERRAGKLSEKEAAECLQQVNYFGTLLVYQGYADGLVSGAVHSTGETVRPALQIIKTKPGIERTFGYFLMLKDDIKYIMADCAINPNPKVEDLASFAIESAKAATMFGFEPHVAMLSYSTNLSANTEEAQKMRAAAALAKQLDPTLSVDGEMQFDAAVVPEVGASKFAGSTVAGKANVFIFPDLNSGNIGYKMVQRLGGFEAIGPVLAGLNQPVNDLSRGCNADDVYHLAIITAAQALESKEA